MLSIYFFYAWYKFAFIFYGGKLTPKGLFLHFAYHEFKTYQFLILFLFYSQP